MDFPQSEIRVGADAGLQAAADRAGVKASYAVTWCTGNRRQATGRLELGPNAIELEGAANGQAVREEIPYRELASVAIGRDGKDRLDGRQTLVLERTGRRPVLVAGVAQAWVVSELAERLASLHAQRSGR